MCLILTITLSKDDAISKDVLKSWVSPNLKVELYLAKSAFSKKSNILHASEVRQGCACSLLTDNADWNSLYSDMIPEFLPDLAQLLKLLRQNTKSGFSFQALWVGETPLEHIKISIDELVQVIENGKIGTKTKYLIT
jgi:hypothetical protein